MGLPSKTMEHLQWHNVVTSGPFYRTIGEKPLFSRWCPGSSAQKAVHLAVVCLSFLTFSHYPRSSFRTHKCHVTWPPMPLIFSTWEPKISRSSTEPGFLGLYFKEGILFEWKSVWGSAEAEHRVAGDGFVGFCPAKLVAFVALKPKP